MSNFKKTSYSYVKYPINCIILEYIDNAERSERFLRAKFKIKANNTSFRLFKV